MFYSCNIYRRDGSLNCPCLFIRWFVKKSIAHPFLQAELEMNCLTHGFISLEIWSWKVRRIKSFYFNGCFFKTLLFITYLIDTRNERTKDRFKKSTKQRKSWLKWENIHTENTIYMWKQILLAVALASGWSSPTRYIFSDHTSSGSVSSFLTPTYPVRALNLNKTA